MSHENAGVVLKRGAVVDMPKMKKVTVVVKLMERWVKAALVASTILAIQLMVSAVPGAGSYFVKDSLAAYGQCRWEGGPGYSSSSPDPTVQYCLEEDCIGAGGYAECVDPHIGPAPFDGIGPTDGNGWAYSFAFPTTQAYPWCALAGGTADGAGQCTVSRYTPDEATAMSWGARYFQPPYLHTACSGSITDTGWGFSGIAIDRRYGNSGVGVGLLYKGGILVSDYRRLSLTNTPCNTPDEVVIGRARDAVCPKDAFKRTKPDGDFQCWKPMQIPSICCGNPVLPADGSKMQREVDYRIAGTGGLEFVRYFNSGGHLLPKSLADKPTNEYYSWLHSYQRTVIPFTGNPSLMAVVQHEDGTRRYYDGLGNEIHNTAGKSSHLSFTGSGYQLTNTNGDKDFYDVGGRLISAESRSGVVISLSYNAAGKISFIKDSFGNQLSLGYNPDDSLSTMADPSGSVTNYGYDQYGRLTTVTFPDNTQKNYLYEDFDNRYLLSGIQDENATRFSTYIYQSNGKIRSENHAGVEQYLFSTAQYTGMQKSVALVGDPLGRDRIYTFRSINGVYRIESVQNCPSCGLPKMATYDVNGNPLSKTDYNNVTTTYGYDLSRNLELSRTEASGTPRARTILTTWHPIFRFPTSIIEPNLNTTFDYDSSGNLLSKTLMDIGTGSSRVWVYTYNNLGQILTVDGPRTDIEDKTAYSYYDCATGYECGNIHTVTNALGHVITYNAYNAHGQPLAITDSNGLVTTLTYDQRQRLTSRSVGGEQVIFDYWPTGLLKKVTYPDLSFITYNYDAAHRLTQITDTDGNRISYTLDAMGNRTAETIYDNANAVVYKHSRVFNNLNQLASEINSADTAAVTTSFGYDEIGNRTNIGAPMGRNTVSSYDEHNRLTQVTDSGAGITKYDYNALDQLISVTDPRNLQTQYLYNALGDLTQQISPDTGATANAFDSGGNLSSTTDARNQTVTYGYDALNRVTHANYSDQAINYSYDNQLNGKGRLIQITDASGNTEYTYTALGRVATRTQVTGGLTKTLGYGYSLQGQLATLTTPSGQVIAYGYTNGKLTSLTVNGGVVLDQVTSSPFGPITGWIWGNGTLTTRSYDLDGRLTVNTSAGNSGYTYHPDGSIATRSDDTWENPNLPLGSTTFFTAATSNRLNNSTGTVSRTYSYDQAGNTTSDGTRTFTYNGANRLATATSGAITTTYLYNALGQRVRKSNSSQTTYFVHDEAGHLLGEYDQNGALIQELVWLGDIPVATIRMDQGGSGVGVFYIHTDHLNAPTKITRPADNQIIWRWDHDPYGNGTPNEDPDGNGLLLTMNLRYPGQYYDQETGLLYNWHRYYDPSTGRYITSDPIGLAGGINTFAYVGGNPISRVDPLGLEGTTMPGAPGLPVYIPPVAIPGTPENDQWVDTANAAFEQFTDGLGNIAQAIKDACKSKDGKCKEIEQQVAAAAAEMRARYLAALADPKDLYNDARLVAYARRVGTWYGHQQQFNDTKNRLKKWIAAADANGCTVSADDRRLLSAVYPPWPLPRN